MQNRLVLRFPALAVREFRLFFLGQLVSQTGTWMQSIATAWLIYRLTDSPFWLGLASFSSQIPILLLSTSAGVWNDRFDRRRILLGSQIAALAQALLLVLLVGSESATPLWLIVLSLALGVIHAVDLPARQAFLSQLVRDKMLLPSAIGLNSFLMNASRFVGPLLAGLIVSHFGELYCFLVNALSYLAVIMALLAIPANASPERGKEPFLAAFRAGFAHALTTPRIRDTLLLIAGFSFFITPYATLMPVFARDVFGGGATLYGSLLSSAGLGSLAAALFLAGATKPDRLLGRVVMASRAAGLLLAAFAVVPWLGLAYPLLALIGFSVILTIAGANTLIQLAVQDSFRGRVMALFSTAFLGIGPLGSLAAGTVAEHFGARAVLLGCGLIALLLAGGIGARLKGTRTS